jgi:hypothetical protein
MRERVFSDLGLRCSVADDRSRKSVPLLINLTPESPSVPFAERSPAKPSHSDAPLPICGQRCLISFTASGRSHSRYDRVRL